MSSLPITFFFQNTNMLAKFTNFQPQRGKKKLIQTILSDEIHSKDDNHFRFCFYQGFTRTGSYRYYKEIVLGITSLMDSYGYLNAFIVLRLIC